MGYKEGEWASLDIGFRPKVFSFSQGNAKPPEWRVKMLFVNDTIGNWTDKLSSVEDIDLRDCLSDISGTSYTERVLSLTRSIAKKIDGAFEAQGLPKYSDMQDLFDSTNTADISDFAVGLMGPFAYVGGTTTVVKNAYNAMNTQNQTVAEFMLGENASSSLAVVNDIESVWQVLSHENPDDEGSYVDTKFSGDAGLYNGFTPMPNITAGTFSASNAANVTLVSTNARKRLPLVVVPYSAIKEVRTTVVTGNGIKSTRHWARIESMSQTSTLNMNVVLFFADSMAFNFQTKNVEAGPCIVLPDGWYLLDQTLETVEPESPEGTPLIDTYNGVFAKLEFGIESGGKQLYGSWPIILETSPGLITMQMDSASLNPTEPTTDRTKFINELVPDVIKRMYEFGSTITPDIFVLGDNLANVYKGYLYKVGDQDNFKLINFDTDFGELFTKPYSDKVSWTGLEEVRAVNNTGFPTPSITASHVDSSYNLGLAQSLLAIISDTRPETSTTFRDAYGLAVNVLTAETPTILHEYLAIDAADAIMTNDGVWLPKVSGTIYSFTTAVSGDGLIFRRADSYTMKFEIDNPATITIPGLNPSPGPDPGPDPAPYDPPTLDPLPDIDPSYPSTGTTPDIPTPSDPDVTDKIYGDDTATPDPSKPNGDYGSSGTQNPVMPPSVPGNTPDGLRVRALSQTKYNSFTDYLWNGNLLEQIKKFFDDPTELIFRVNMLPFDIPSNCLGVAQDDIKFNWINLGNWTGTNYPVTSRVATVDFGHVQIPGYFDTFVDYPPYAKARIYLPFIGNVPLDPAEITNHTVYLRYFVDLITGDATAVLTSGDVGIIGTYNTNVAYDLPVSSRNFGELITSLAIAGLSMGVAGMTGAPIMPQLSNSSAGPEIRTISQPVESVPSTGMTLYQGQTEALGNTYVPNVFDMMSGGQPQGGSNPMQLRISPDEINALSSAWGVAQNGVEVQRSNGLSGNAGWNAPMKPYIYITYPTPNTSREHGSILGYPSNVAGALNDFKGYNLFSKVYLQVTGDITQEEISEIKALLKGGIVI